jgi:hypothetical protein
VSPLVRAGRGVRVCGIQAGAHYLDETVPPAATEKETLREAEKVRTKLINQVDERRNPRTRASLNELHRWLDVVKLEHNTRTGYVGKIEKHIRPTIGHLPVARVDAEVIDSLYARLRTCKEHCNGRRYVEHRTTGDHECDEHRATPCKPARPQWRGSLSQSRCRPPAVPSSGQRGSTARLCSTSRPLPVGPP